MKTPLIIDVSSSDEPSLLKKVLADLEAMTSTPEIREQINQIKGWLNNEKLQRFWAEQENLGLLRNDLI